MHVIKSKLDTFQLLLHHGECYLETFYPKTSQLCGRAPGLISALRKRR